MKLRYVSYDVTSLRHTMTKFRSFFAKRSGRIHRCLFRHQKLKHRAYHSWQLVFRNHVWNPADFMCEIHMKSARFHLKSVRNLLDFTWNLPDFMKSVRNLPDFMNVSFCMMIKYRSFFRKTNKNWKSYSDNKISISYNTCLSWIMKIAWTSVESECTFSLFKETKVL